LYMQLPRMFLSTNPAVQCTPSFISVYHNGHQPHHVSPTGSVISTQPLTYDGELQDNLLEA
jgi:hypothetical protein